ncbi:MAG TPA: exodeoxyribonuclease VII small subunit [Thermodesulfobium narugense]|uniref:Exodeoxyribonuclease VII small subunit n=1 Tax=Thermodesulfobium acidiphilum TaxID=1794699 RepID=A0A2R4VZI6_THEAF|nr:exodeoxyribonuclease VII small subunit [Thermodesulfobium acidiphilum]AWB09830.1 Exodeoxyribonuclease VII small subunit [Thermodesulfobium acidiphilum]PMP85936.1 MAG: exodeoxyribonuclease VII small subunit [Thermodesulfobium narugense]HEM55838.1 exodeoxyribonuclease VII small subunit [Thermodesulfobium narugense]
MNEEISYKEALDELNSIVQKIESDEIDMDELSNIVKRALFLVNLCKSKLKKTEDELQSMFNELNS